MIFSSSVELMRCCSQILFSICLFFFFSLNTSGLFEETVFLLFYFLHLNLITVVWHRTEECHGKVVLYVCMFSVEGDEKACDPSQSYNVTWYLRYSDCYNEVFNFGVRIVWKNMGYDF